MKMIELPNACPACNGSVDLKNDILYCLNKACPARASKQIEHFVKTLKIKGLGPKTLEKLELSDVSDLFKLTARDIVNAVQSEKIAAKILAEVKNAEKAPANILLPAFGIPLIGKTAAEKLSQVCDSIFNIDRDSCREAGLGPKATENLITWIETYFAEHLGKFPQSFEFEKVVETGHSSEVVCITGKLKSFKTKAEATSKLQELGFTVKDSLTKDVTILVNESGLLSAKTLKAQQQGVRVVTNLQTFLGEIINGTSKVD